MSYLWHFQTFSLPKLQSYLGSDDQSKQDALLNAVLWDDLGEEGDELEKAARRIATQGLDYTGLDADEAEMTDEIVKMLPTPEGLEQEIELEYESDDGLHPNVVDELVKRAGASAGLSILPLLQSGRRYGQAQPANCEYCIFDLDELATLQGEVEQAMAQPGDWSASYVPEVIKECLLTPVHAARSKGKALFGLLG